MSTSTKITKKFLRGQACDEGAAWLKDQTDLEAAWEKCKRPDWMMWALHQMYAYEDPNILVDATKLYVFLWNQKPTNKNGNQIFSELFDRMYTTTKPKLMCDVIRSILGNPFCNR